MLRMNQHKNSSPDYERAKELRRSSPQTERALWNSLSIYARQRNLKFRKQYPLHPYVVDFVCLKARLVIEIDGMSHDARLGYDKVRDAFLRKSGYTILRFGNDEVKANLEGIVLQIVETAENLIARNPNNHIAVAPAPNPSREGRGITPVLLQKISVSLPEKGRRHV